MSLLCSRFPGFLINTVLGGSDRFLEKEACHFQSIESAQAGYNRAAANFLFLSFFFLHRAYPQDENTD